MTIYFGFDFYVHGFLHNNFSQILPKVVLANKFSKMYCELHLCFLCARKGLWVSDFYTFIIDKKLLLIKMTQHKREYIPRVPREGGDANIGPTWLSNAYRTSLNGQCRHKGYGF